MEELVEKLRRVVTGLKLVTLSLGVLLLNAVAGAVVLVTFLEFKSSPAAMLHALHRDHANVMMGLTALGVLSRLLAMAGKVYCISVPLKSAATTLIVMSTVASGVGLLLSLAGQMPDFADYADDLTGLGLVLSTLGYLYFLRFLGQLAKFLGSARLRIRARHVLVGSASVLGLLFITGLSGGAGGVAIVVGLMAGLGGLVVFGMYALLVNDMRRLTEGAAAYAEERGDLVDL